MIWFAYLSVAALIALSAGDLKDVRHCAVAIALCLVVTKAVTFYATGVSAYALWSAVWCVAAVATIRQMWCSALLFASGLCYLPVYLAGFSVGAGETVSIVIDCLGIVALAVLGGQVIGGRLGSGGVVRFLGMGYPFIRGHH